MVEVQAGKGGLPWGKGDGVSRVEVLCFTVIFEKGRRNCVKNVGRIRER